MEKDIELLRSTYQVASNLGITSVQLPTQDLGDLVSLLEFVLNRENEHESEICKMKELLDRANKDTKKWYNMFSQSTVKYSELRQKFSEHIRSNTVNVTLDTTEIKQYIDQIIATRSFDGCEPLRKMSEMPDPDPDLEGSHYSVDVELLTVGGEFVKGYFALSELSDFELKNPITQILENEEEINKPITCFQGWRPIKE